LNVTIIGLCPTPVLYFSLFHLNPGAGVMITGSHNPAEFNGFKLCVGKDTIFGGEIQKIRRIMEQEAEKAHGSSFIGREEAREKAESREHGAEGKKPRAMNYEPTAMSHQPSAMSHSPRAENRPILPDYIDYLIKQFTQYREVPLKVVLDAGNGTAGLVAPEIIRSMGCSVIELFSEPDGRFPNHHPDPTIPKNLSALIDTVHSQKADIGIAFDGDSDRIGAVDEQGNILWGDQLMVIFSRDILTERPGATFVSEVKCSQTMYDDIRSRGGKAIMWKTGHSLIKAKMKEVHAALAGEMSGHLFFADRYYGYDDAIYAACRLVEILKKFKSRGGGGVTASMLIADLPRTYNTPEIRFDCPDHLKFKVVEQAKDVFMRAAGLPRKPREVITVDGIRAVFDNGWGLIRASNTQPVLVMRFEANDPAALESIKTMMEEKVNAILSGLKSS
jgi:phosphomannomutase/phosphoglucomutase